MPRPRTLTDEQLLDGAARVIARIGPTRLTLAEVGREIGLSPATLVQRFGSKRDLMLALVRHSTLTTAEQFAADAGPAGRSLWSLGDTLADRAKRLTPQALANHLAFLQLDLTDPEFRRLAGEHARALRQQIQNRLDDAVAAGQLPAQDTARLSRSVQVAYNGALLTWALEPEGPVQESVRDQIETLLIACGAPPRA